MSTPSLGRGPVGRGLCSSNALFVTQLLNAFNDNLFKNAMVLFVVYSVYNSEAAEGQFSAIASAVFILPFFVH